MKIKKSFINSVFISCLMSINLLSYGASTETIDAQMEYVTGVNIEITTNGSVSKDITYDSRDLANLTSLDTVFPLIGLRITAGVGSSVSAEIVQKLKLISAENGVISTEMSFEGGGVAEIVEGKAKYTQTISSAGYENFNLKSEMKNLATELPKTGSYTANAFIVGYFN